MKKALKHIGLMAAILAGGAVIGYLLIVLSYGLIKIAPEKYEAAWEILDDEGYHPRDYEHNRRTDYYFEQLPDILDLATDQIIVTHSMEAPEGGAFRHSVIESYYRYWHGYIIFWRPLLKFFELGELRIFNFFLQASLAILLAWLLWKGTGKKRFALAWLTVYTVLVPNSMALNFQYSSSYYVAVLSAIALMLFKGYFAKPCRYFYLFLVTGMLTVYFDFLTYPLLTWALPACIMLLVLPYARKVILSAVFWATGYVIFWAEKWLIASIITGENAFADGLNQIVLRSGSDGYGLADRIESFNRNWAHLSFLPFVILFLIWILWWVVCYFAKGLKPDARALSFALIALSSFVWLFAAAQHTGSHPHFAWRNSAAAVTAGLMLIGVGTDTPWKEAKKPSVRTLLMRAGIFAAICAVTLVCYRFIPVETYFSENFGAEVTSEKVLSPGEKEAARFTITPLYERICQIVPVVDCGDASGNIDITVLDGGSTFYSESIDVADREGTRTLNTKVDWRLTKGKPVDVIISTENATAPVTVWIPEEGAGNAADISAMMFGIVYYSHFANKTDTLFYLMSWFSLFMMIVYCFCGKIKIGSEGKSQLTNMI